MDVTKTYRFIGFGAMYVTKPYKFMGFGFKVEFKKPKPQSFPSVPVGTVTFNLERSTLVSRTRPRRRQG